MNTKDMHRDGYRRPAQKSKMGQLNITLPVAMLDRIDELGEKTGIRRSALIQAALTDYFRTKDLQDKAISSLLNTLPLLLPEAAGDLLPQETVEEDFDGEGGHRYEYKPGLLG